METFPECETVCREPPPVHVFVGSLAEINPRKVAEVVRRSRDIRSLQYTPITTGLYTHVSKKGPTLSGLINGPNRIIQGRAVQA